MIQSFSEADPLVVANVVNPEWTPGIADVFLNSWNGVCVLFNLVHLYL